jgi:hypothetical protein
MTATLWGDALTFKADPERGGDRALLYFRPRHWDTPAPPPDEMYAFPCGRRFAYRAVLNGWAFVVSRPDGRVLLVIPEAPD